MARSSLMALWTPVAIRVQDQLTQQLGDRTPVRRAPTKQRVGRLIEGMKRVIP